MPPEGESIVQFAANYWIPILVGAVGVIGSIASVISWHSARRSRRVYDTLFQAAQQFLEREAKTEELDVEIAKKKNQASEYDASLQRYSERILALQEQIRRDIPKAARRAILQDRLDESVSLMKAHYDEVVAILAELQSLGEDTELSRELLQAVRRQIQPRHVLRERRSHLLALLTVITTLAAAASTLLPWPLSRVVGFILLLVAVPVIGILFVDFVIASSRNRDGRGKRDRQYLNEGEESVPQERGGESDDLPG